jgi:hypothetical protein
MPKKKLMSAKNAMRITDPAQGTVVVIRSCG